MFSEPKKPSLKDIGGLMNGLTQYLIIFGIPEKNVMKFVNAYNEIMADWHQKNVKEAEIIDITPFIDYRKEDDEQEEEPEAE